MGKKLISLLIGLLAMGIVITGCTESSKWDRPEILKIESRTPALNATGVDYRDSLSLTFNFPFDKSKIGINDLFARYGSDHTAGTPDLSTARLEWSTDKKTLTILGIKGWSNLTRGVGPKAVEVVAGEGKIKDVIGNEIYSGKVLWKFTLLDERAPLVLSVSPSQGATGISTITQIKAVFSEDMDASTINTSTFTVSGSQVTGSVSYDAASKTAIFTPSANLSFEATYTVTVSGSVKDLAGNAMGTPETWSFTTKQAWAPQVSGTSDPLFGVHFVGANHGWAVGVSGTILNTSDGGTNWVPQTSGTSNHLYDVYFVDANNGWAVGVFGTILYTSDGGTNWVPQTSGTSNFLYGVYFVDTNHGWAVGALGTILYTSDGGVTWVPQTSGTSVSLPGVHFVDVNHGWVVGLNDTILYTSDGGTNWTPQTSGTTYSIYDVYFVDSNNGWAAADKVTIFHTSDGGANWAIQFTDSSTSNGLLGVYFIDLDNGWVVGDAGTSGYTSDGGMNWIPLTSGTSQPLYGVHFVDLYNGWAVGFNGTILKYSP